MTKMSAGEVAVVLDWRSEMITRIQNIVGGCYPNTSEEEDLNAAEAVVEVLGQLGYLVGPDRPKEEES